MYKPIRLMVLSGVFSLLGFAETWSGTLVDANCAAQNKSSAHCAPTSSTSAFALMLADGKTVKLDANGNTKAADALKNSADRSKNPNATTPVKAKVSGTLSGDTIAVDTVDVQ